MFNSNDYNATCNVHGLVTSYFYVENNDTNEMMGVCYICATEHLKSIVGELSIVKKEVEEVKNEEQV